MVRDSQVRRELEKRSCESEDISKRNFVIGFVKGAVIGGIASTGAHYTFPSYRKFTLPFKVFLPLAVAITYATVQSDWALTEYEARKRIEDIAKRRGMLREQQQRLREQAEGSQS